MVPPNTRGCISFTDLVVDDNIDSANFTIVVENSTAWVQILDDDGDGEGVTTLDHFI